MRVRNRVQATIVLLSALVLVALAIIVITPDSRRFWRGALGPSSPHAQYARSLHRSGLAATALGRDWLAAGERALTRPVAVALPLKETGYFPRDEPVAVGYRVEMRRGQKLLVAVEIESREAPRLFIDVFEVSDPQRSIAFAAPDKTQLEYEARRDGVFLVRLQPELLRSGRYTLVQRLTASLLFPVPGFDRAAVLSVFGDARDGGIRRHEGIDIFAPLGTPVVAAADGFVTSVGTTELGGNVVSVWDRTRGQSLYYAHLHAQRVRQGARVGAGDVLGTVGNTGNAVTTPPHLHFGIYHRTHGALDPFPFVEQPAVAVPLVLADTNLLGSWARIGSAVAFLHDRPDEGATVLEALPSHTILSVRAALAGWYRVELPSGASGFVLARRTEPATHPVGRTRGTLESPVRDWPVSTAAVVETITAGATVSVFGRFSGFLFVRTPKTSAGWLAGTASRATADGR